MRCGRDPRPAAGSALQRLYEATAAERAKVAVAAPLVSVDISAEGWLVAAQFRAWRAATLLWRRQRQRAIRPTVRDALLDKLMRHAANRPSLLRHRPLTLYNVGEGLGIRMPGLMESRWRTRGCSSGSAAACAR